MQKEWMGFNPLAVADAIRRKRQIIENGEGPVLLDTVTYRYSGHSPSDQSSYREKAEIEAWREHDPIVSYARDLVKANICSQSKIDQISEQSVDLVVKALRKSRRP